MLEQIQNVSVAAENITSTSSTLLQLTWSWLYHDYAAADELWLWTVFFAITFVYFWGFNIFFMILELTGPTYFLKYRIQLDQKPPVVERRLFFKCVRGVLFNQLVIGIPFHFSVYYVWQWRGGLFGEELPTFQRLVAELLVSALALEFGFYYTHRMLHWPFWYKNVHKVHHEWKTPISISSIYCHPVEYFLSNLLPLVAGPLLLGSHFVTGLLWVLISSGSGCIAHCGFHMPFLPSNETHEFHHAQFNQVFGMLGILDTLHGSNSRFKTTVNYARHFMLLGTTPAYVLVPDREGKAK